MSTRRRIKKNSSGDDGVVNLSGQMDGQGMKCRSPPEAGRTGASSTQGRKKVFLSRSRSFMDSSWPRSSVDALRRSPATDKGLPRNDGNTHGGRGPTFLRVETVSGEVMKRWELETRLRVLKQNLHGKWVELQALLLQERRLLKGSQRDFSHQDTVALLEMGLPGGSSSVSSAFLNKHRFSSDSSCRSRLSSMMEGSEDGYYHKPVFDDLASEALSRQTSEDDEDSLFMKDHSVSPLSPFSGNRSISGTSSGSSPTSPFWDTCSLYSDFGTLPRKSRRGSVRQHILKFIPGLHKSMEKEESGV